MAVKDSVPLSPLKPSATPADTDQHDFDAGSSALGNDLQPPSVSMETSNLQSQTPKTEDDVKNGDEAGGPLTISELAYRSADCSNILISIASIASFYIGIKLYDLRQ